jgi:hypothetical protein
MSGIRVCAMSQSRLREPTILHSPSDAEASGVKATWLIGFLLLVFTGSFAIAEPTLHARIDRVDRTYQVNPDLSFVATIEVDATLLTARGIRDWERATYSFYPKSQTLEVLEAWVDQPDGARIPVAEGSRFTRPSAAAQNAPGFTGSLTTTLLFPQLREGSRTHVIWRLTQKTPAPLGFNVSLEPPLETPVGTATVAITAPQNLDLHWAARGGFVVSDTVEAGQRHINARISDTRAEEPERAMVSPSDFQPLFLVSSLPDLQSLGRIYFQQSNDKATVTPQTAAQAARIAGDRHGLDAARAVYDWVASNIRYVAVYLDPNDGWVPHAADEVLRNGYGDCKDHVVLMQALLAALGVRAEAALVDWSDRTTDLPLWLPQFNHAIVYLPDFDWFANPTSPYARFDSLDRRMAGKTVVIATAEGRVSRTPPMRPEENLYRMDGRVVIAADGSLSGSAKMVLSAGPEDSARAAVAQSDSPEDLAERMLASTPEGGEGTFLPSNPRDLSRPFSVEGTWHSPHGVLFEGANAYMTTPVGLDMEPPSRLRYYLSGDGPRRHGVLIAAGDLQWSTTLSVPAGVVFARLPADVNLHNEAGSFAATYQRVGRDLTVVRRLVIEHSVYSAASYPALRDLLYAAIDDARSVLVLAKAEAEASAAP